jgi:hypothetical protein
MRPKSRRSADDTRAAAAEHVSCTIDKGKGLQMGINTLVRRAALVAVGAAIVIGISAETGGRSTGEP